MPPKRVFSPLGVFDFDAQQGSMRILSLHPGVTVAQVQAATGFEMIVPATIEETPPPSEVELAVLRRRVDPAGLLQQLRITR
jgi:glutaconate CoA-transferase subunit B